MDNLGSDFVIRVGETAIGRFCFQSTVEVVERFVDFLPEFSELEDCQVFILRGVKVLVESSDGRFVGCASVR